MKTSFMLPPREATHSLQCVAVHARKTGNEQRHHSEHFLLLVHGLFPQRLRSLPVGWAGVLVLASWLAERLATYRMKGTMALRRSFLYLSPYDLRYPRCFFTAQSAICRKPMTVKT
jgi:hypothetical protein